MFKIINGVLRYIGLGNYRLGGISPAQNPDEAINKEQFDGGQNSLQTQINSINAGDVDNGTVTQTISITTGVSINKIAGVITTVPSTLGPFLAATFTVSNIKVTSSSIIIAQICGYSGTFVNDGFPIIVVSNVITNAFDIVIFNSGDGSAALNGIIKISFIVLK